MPHDQKQSLHIQDQKEMSTVDEEIKESGSILFILFFPKAIKSFQAPFHAVETM